VKIKSLAFVMVLALALALVACEQLALSPTTPTPSPTPAPPLEQIAQTAQTFMEAWQRSDWGAMYGLLASAAQQSISQGAFTQRYRGLHNEMALLKLQAQRAGTEAISPERVDVLYDLVLETTLLGPVNARNRLAFVPEGAAWRIAWTPQAMLEDLQEGMLVRLSIKSPQRGNIYARDGTALAIQEKVISVGVVPQWIQDENKLLDTLSSALGMPREAIRNKYASAARQDWFMPVADITQEQNAALQGVLANLSGVSRQEKLVRAYPQGDLFAHIVGYTGQISAEEWEQWRSLGYMVDDTVGKAGVERWAERPLAGKRGGTLAIMSGEQTVKVLKDVAAQPSQSVYLALDPALQKAAYEALGDRAGAVVALDPTNGDVLAMVSRPSFNANEMSRGLSAAQWQALLDNPLHPLVNRATLGQYPPASVFKIVSMTAALQEGAFAAESSFFCPGSWMGLNDGLVRNCWLKTGHNTIDLFYGLVQSCDVVFYEVGKALDETNAEILPGYASKFGLGQLTGIQGVDEAAGLVPNPAWKQAHPDQVSNPFWTTQDAVNMAIGQGYMLVTPLQAANLLAAVGNGGTLYRPRLVHRIMSLGGGTETAFAVESIGQLPISPEHLDLIQEALREVAMEPYGTAYLAFAGIQVPVAGKTGTAEAGPTEPHAWFAGYAPTENPTIAVAVVVDHGGEGGVESAPIFRKAVESYLGLAQAAP